MKKTKILACLFIVTLNANSQELLPGEKNLNVQPILGPGVERVGSSGIPVPKLGNRNAFQNSRFNQEILPAISSKNIYDTTSGSNRLLYLNGVNISQVRNQDLNQVNVRIDGNGVVYIEAPQYEVVRKQNYHPLLPNEIPKNAKESLLSPNTPKGIYSKETGLPSTINPNNINNNNSQNGLPTGQDSKQKLNENKAFTPEEAVQNEKNLKDLNDKETSENSELKQNSNAPFPKELSPKNAPNVLKDEEN